MSDKKPAYGEGGDDYPDIVATFGENCRIIRSSDTRPATQWILQYRNKAGGWASDKFLQSKVGLKMYAPLSAEELEAMPDWCPQRDEPLRPRKRHA